MSSLLSFLSYNVIRQKVKREKQKEGNNVGENPKTKDLDRQLTLLPNSNFGTFNFLAKHIS